MDRNIDGKISQSDRQTWCIKTLNFKVGHIFICIHINFNSIFWFYILRNRKYECFAVKKINFKRQTKFFVGIKLFKREGDFFFFNQL